MLRAVRAAFITIIDRSILEQRGTITNLRRCLPLEGTVDARVLDGSGAASVLRVGDRFPSIW